MTHIAGPLHFFIMPLGHSGEKACDRVGSTSIDINFLDFQYDCSTLLSIASSFPTIWEDGHATAFGMAIALLEFGEKGIRYGLLQAVAEVYQSA
jgi:hypothetical protein